MTGWSALNEGVSWKYNPLSYHRYCQALLVSSFENTIYISALHFTLTKPKPKKNEDTYFCLTISLHLTLLLAARDCDVLMAKAQCPSLGGCDQESPPRPASAQSPSDPPRPHSSPHRSEEKSRRPWRFKPCWIFYRIIMLYRLTFDAVPKDHVAIKNTLIKVFYGSSSWILFSSAKF